MIKKLKPIYLRKRTPNLPRGVFRLPADLGDRAFTLTNNRWFMKPLMPYLMGSTFGMNVIRPAKEAIKKAKKEGIAPIFIGTDTNLRSKDGKTLLRHEQIHQLHFSDPNNPFFKNELKASGNTSLHKVLSSQMGDYVIDQYTSRITSLPKKYRRFERDTELLAHSYHNDTHFFRRAAKAKVKLPKAMANKSYSQSAKLVDKIMSKGYTKSGAGIVRNFISRVAKVL